MTADSMDGIVLLTVVTPAKSKLTKTLRRSDTGKWFISADYGNIKKVQARESPVWDIGSLSDVLLTASCNTTICAIRGGIRSGFEAAVLRPNGVRRLAYDRPDEQDGQAAFQERARRWVACDLDSFPLPEHIDPIVDIEHVIDAAIERLPPEFRSASCFWQLTSGHGIKRGGRARLFFWLSRPVTNAEATRWIPKSIADPAVHRTVQPIYIAAPILPPGQTDFLSTRCGLRVGELDEVAVPDLTAWTRDVAGSTPRRTSLFVDSVDAALDLMGDPPEFPNGQGFHAPIDAAFKAATQEFGADLDQEALLAQVASKLRERIGRRGDAYLNRRIRDARPWLSWLVKKAQEREARGPTVAPRGHRLPAYFTGPADPSDVALSQQTATIRNVVDQAGRRAAILREVKAATNKAVEGERDHGSTS
jgi:hypothetical protein